MAVLGSRASIPTMRHLAAIALLSAACSRDFESYGWQDWCICGLADGGTAGQTLSFVVCKEQFDVAGARTNYKCRAPAHMAAAGCATAPTCTCEPDTVTYCD